MSILEDLPRVITAIGGLGTAAFGIVDATKVFAGGVNHIGFGAIRTVVLRLTQGAPLEEMTIRTLQANWMNGTHLPHQKAIAKSLIKLNLSSANAAALAGVTGTDPAKLTQIATSMAAGAALNSAQSDVLARFDLIVTAMLDDAYQRSDQVYRNWTRALAAAVAIALAVGGGTVLQIHPVVSVLAGLLATPLAPIAKDLSTTLATAVNRLQRPL